MSLGNRTEELLHAPEDRVNLRQRPQLDRVLLGLLPRLDGVTDAARRLPLRPLRDHLLERQRRLGLVLVEVGHVALARELIGLGADAEEGPRQLHVTEDDAL